MTLLNLETSYPEHVSRIDQDRRVEINFDGRTMRFTVCTFEPGSGRAAQELLDPAGSRQSGGPRARAHPRADFRR